MDRYRIGLYFLNGDVNWLLPSLPPFLPSLAGVAGSLLLLCLHAVWLFCAIVVSLYH